MYNNIVLVGRTNKLIEKLAGISAHLITLSSNPSLSVATHLGIKYEHKLLELEN